jgi:tRNA pseudouridine55 synthase
MATDGLLVIDKPAGPTSHDIVQRVRKLFGLQRVGHGGTLDPEATGVLLIAIGQATRFFPYLSKEDKVYEGRIRLGFATDTYDASGRPTSGGSVDLPRPEAVAAAMKNFEGRILQIPPPFSAKKIDGKPAYRMARAGREFSLEASEVVVGQFRLRGYHPPLIEFDVRCSAGTYIRSLAHDLGRDLECGAHLETLRRTSVGPYALADAVSLEKLEKAAPGNDLLTYLLPLERLLPDVPAVFVLPEAAGRVRNGSPLAPSHLGPRPQGDASPFPGRAPLVRLLGPSGKLLALARPSPDGVGLHPFLVIS